MKCFYMLSQVISTGHGSANVPDKNLAVSLPINKHETNFINPLCA